MHSTPRGASRGTPLLALLLLLLSLGGCASPSPDLYSLEPRPGRVRLSPALADGRPGGRPGGRPSGRPSGRQVTVVRSVGLPRYLEREEIVRAAGGTRLRLAGNDWWGEPLRVMMRRVLVADLAQRLPGADVLADDGPVAAHPDAEVDVDVQRFDRDAGGVDLGGPVLLDGYAAVTHPTPGPGQLRTLDRLHSVVPTVADTTKAQVDAMSTALGQVADAVAGRIAP